MEGVVGEVGKVGKRGERGGGERGGRIVWGLGCNVGYFQSKKYAFIYLCLSPWVCVCVSVCLFVFLRIYICIF